MQAGGMGREVIRGAEHGLAAQGADAGLLQQCLGLGHLFLVPGLGLLFQLRPPRLGLGVVDLGHHLVQAGAVGVGQRIEHAAVGFDGLQQVQRGAQPVGQGQVVVGKGQGGGIQFGSGKSSRKTGRRAPRGGPRRGMRRQAGANDGRLLSLILGFGAERRPSLAPHPLHTAPHRVASTQSMALPREPADLRVPSASPAPVAGQLPLRAAGCERPAGPGQRPYRASVLDGGAVPVL